MSSLAHRQQVLLDALFEWPAPSAIKTVADFAIDTGARGLKAYQTNGHMLAERTLRSAYPVVAQLLGNASFADLSRALWHSHPPTRGDLAQWGVDLPDFLQENSQLQDEAYLPDVARTEWALHGCATQADGAVDLGTLALLTTEDPTALRLRLAPGCFVLRSRWPVASILGAHLEPQRDGQLSLSEVGVQIRAGVAHDIVVWRDGFRPQVRAALPGETNALEALLAGHTLAQALDCAAQLQFETWFPMAIQSGLVLGVTLAS